MAQLRKCLSLVCWWAALLTPMGAYAVPPDQATSIILNIRRSATMVQRLRDLTRCTFTTAQQQLAILHDLARWQRMGEQLHRTECLKVFEQCFQNGGTFNTP